MKEKLCGCKSCVSFVWNCEDWRSWRDAPDELSVKSDRDEFRHRYHSSVGKHIRLAGDAGRNRYVHRVALIAIGSSYLLQYIVRSQRHGLRCCGVHFFTRRGENAHWHSEKDWISTFYQFLPPRRNSSEMVIDADVEPLTKHAPSESICVPLGLISSDALRFFPILLLTIEISYARAFCA